VADLAIGPVTVEPAPGPHGEISPAAQKRLYAEADARFAAFTGITRKLHPDNALDKPYVPIWASFYDDVLKAWRAGTIRWLIDHPVAGPAIADAQAAGQAAAEHLSAMPRAATPDAVTTHAQKAASAQAAAQAATQKAGTVLAQTAPAAPTLPPAVQRASQDVAAIAKPWLDSGQGDVGSDLLAFAQSVNAFGHAIANATGLAPAPLSPPSPGSPGPTPTGNGSGRGSRFTGDEHGALGPSGPAGSPEASHGMLDAPKKTLGAALAVIGGLSVAIVLAGYRNLRPVRRRHTQRRARA